MLLSGPYTYPMDARIHINLLAPSPVLTNWLYRITDATGDWAGSTHPEIISTQPVYDDDQLLCYYFTISPRGYVFVPSRKELPPITAYSETSEFRIAHENPFIDIDFANIQFHFLIFGFLPNRCRGVGNSLGNIENLSCTAIT